MPNSCPLFWGNLTLEQWSDLTVGQYSKLGMTTESIHGPYDHTLFLGCSVMSFSLSMGWNSQQSELTVHLAEDTCTSPAGAYKTYWDDSLSKQTTTAVDPGFFGMDRWQRANGTQYSGTKENTGDTLVRAALDIEGCPVYFRVGDFEYCGIIQSWTQNRGNTANPTYGVKISDPRLLLEGTQVIIDNYAGAVGGAGWSESTGPYNLVNAFGFMEGFGSSAPAYSYDATTGGYLPGNFGPDGATFGSPAGGFGGAVNNDNGVQWNRLALAINLLLNSHPRLRNNWSPYGRVMYRGADSALGMGIMGYDQIEALGPFSGLSNFLSEYLVDISELPVMPDNWRLSGSNINLMDAIQQVCDAAGYDYYVELIPVVQPGLSSSGISKFIKIRTARRTDQINVDAIGQFIGDGDGYISASQGKELRNEPTAAFVLGGEKQTVYQIGQSDDPDGEGDDICQLGDCYETENESADDVILPYFGKYDNGDIIMPFKDRNNGWGIKVYTDKVNSQLAYPLTTGVVTITELEMMAALGGYDTWSSYATSYLDAAGTLYASEAMRAYPPDIEAVAPLNFVRAAKAILDNNAQVLPRDFQQMHPNAGKVKSQVAEEADLAQDLQSIYSWINSFASNYARKFQVRVPYTALRTDGESFQILTSEEPSDGGWTEQTGIIGLPTDQISGAPFFQLDDGRYGAMVRFNSDIVRVVDFYDKREDPDLDETWRIVASGTRDFDMTKFSSDDYIQYSGGTWIRATAEPEYAYMDYDTRFSPRVVLELPAPVHELPDSLGMPGIRSVPLLMEYFAAEKLPAGPARVAAIAKVRDKIKKLLSAPANKMADYVIPTSGYIPDAAAFGLKSNILRYGPWITEGPAGQIKIETDDGLVPWQYGNYRLMNLAGQAIADEGITQRQVGEMGDINAPGYPTLPGGTELLALGQGFYGPGTHLVEHRTTSATNYNQPHQSLGSFNVDYYNVPIGGWDGTYGPNITNVSVNVGPGGVSTTYAMRTHTPQYGKFAKYNAGRLQKISQNAMTVHKDRKNVLKLAKTRSHEGMVAAESRRLKGLNEEGVDVGVMAGPARSPHEALVGSYYKWTAETSATGTGIADTGNYMRTCIATEPLSEIPSELAGGGIFDYSDKAICSWDALFRPAEVDGESNLPQYQDNKKDHIYPGLGEDVGGWTQPKGAQPPLNSVVDTGVYGTGAANTGITGFSQWVTNAYDNLISSTYLNAFAITNGFPQSGYSNTPDHGHDVDIIARGLSAPTGTGGLLMGFSALGTGSGFDSLKNQDYPTEGGQRPMVIRGPVIVGGWGFDLDGRPVPASADDPTKFIDHWMRKPQTWKVGPIDLRWDDERNCWTAPPSYRLTYSVFQGFTANGNYDPQTDDDGNIIGYEMQPGWGPAITYKGADGLVDATGGTLETGVITAVDFMNLSPVSGDRIATYFDPFHRQHIIITAPGSGSTTSGVQESQYTAITKTGDPSLCALDDACNNTQTADLTFSWPNNPDMHEGDVQITGVSRMTPGWAFQVVSGNYPLTGCCDEDNSEPVYDIIGWPSNIFEKATVKESGLANPFLQDGEFGRYTLNVTVDRLLTDGSPLPPNLLANVPTPVRSLTELALRYPSGTPVYIEYNQAAADWYVKTIPSDEVWVEVKEPTGVGGWVNQEADVARLVHVTPIRAPHQSSGPQYLTEEEAAFPVWVPPSPNQDLAIWSGDKLTVKLDNYGSGLVTSDCYDDPIGTIKMYNGGTLRRGWRILPDSCGRTIVGWCTSEECADDSGYVGSCDYTTVGTTGGITGIAINPHYVPHTGHAHYMGWECSDYTQVSGYHGVDDALYVWEAPDSYPYDIQTSAASGQPGWHTQLKPGNYPWDYVDPPTLVPEADLDSRSGLFHSTEDNRMPWIAEKIQERYM